MTKIDRKPHRYWTFERVRDEALKYFSVKDWEDNSKASYSLAWKRGWQPRGWSVGHIVAMANGGTHTWDNVQCECIECNTKKGTATYGQIALPFAA